MACRATSWYPPYFAHISTTINKRASKQIFQAGGGQIKLLGIEGDVKYNKSTLAEWTVLLEDIDRDVKDGKVKILPQSARVPFEALHESLEWCKKEGSARYIIIASCPERIGSKKDVLEQIYEIASPYENVDFCFASRDDLGQNLYGNPSLEAVEVLDVEAVQESDARKVILAVDMEKEPLKPAVVLEKEPLMPDTATLATRKHPISCCCCFLIYLLAVIVFAACGAVATTFTVTSTTFTRSAPATSAPISSVPATSAPISSAPATSAQTTAAPTSSSVASSTRSSHKDLVHLVMKLGNMDRNTAEDAVENGNVNLKSESISNNDAQDFAEVLKSGAHPPLYNLQLESSNVGDRGALDIANALKSNCGQLSSLQLYSHNIGIRGARAIADALMSCPNKVNLNMKKNGISNSEVGEIKQALPDNGVSFW